VNKDIVHYGFIGCGMMGQEHLRNLALISNTQVSAIFEPNGDMQDAARLLAPHAVFYDSIEAILAQQHIDAWVIASPNFCHAEQIEHIAKTNPKPMLVEKPICTNLAAVQSLRALEQSLKVPVWTAMEYRYMPAIAALIERTHAQQDTGQAVMFTVREHRYPFLTKVQDWNRFEKNTGGTLVEKCCHFFDLMRLVLQDDPISLFASGGQNVNHLAETYAGRTPDILDNAYVVLNFPHGRRALLELCMFAEGSRYQEELCVVGPKGKIDCKVPGPGRFWPPELGPAPVAQLTISQRHITGSDGWTNQPSIRAVAPKTIEIAVDTELLAAGDHNGSTYYQHQQFFRLAQQFKIDQTSLAVQVSFSDGIKAVVIGLAAEQSAKTGVAISLNDGDYKL
jgi:myo-inositol 2-dehydrogenase / D-chiro-inositol 1-dehydrogenase